MDWHEVVEHNPHVFKDFVEAPDVGAFFGRARELTTLEQWIVGDRCRLVAIVGIRGTGKTYLSVKLGEGGIGKTDLSLKLAQNIERDFDFIIWRRLLNAPTLGEYLTDVIKVLSHQQETELPDTVDRQISRLLHYLTQHRCLFILDNFESVLQGGERAGQYRKDYEGYGQLLEKIRDVDHQSCLLLTSREKPQEIRPVANGPARVQWLELGGLDPLEAHQVFAMLGEFSASDLEWQQLLSFYDGNPLALELAANHIHTVFNGSISDFLRDGKPIFNDLQQLLDWHFKRLSSQEQEIAYWLAIHREPVSIPTLREDILLPSAKYQLTSTLELLQRRLPLENSTAGYTLQPVLIEYLTDRLIQHILQELETNAIDLFNRYALMRAMAKDYLRKTQSRLLLSPIANQFSTNPQPLIQLFEHLRTQPQLAQGYAAGNCLNLLRLLKSDLSSCNLSDLTLRQADLQGTELHQLNLAGASIQHCNLTQSFGAFFTVAFSPDGQSIVTAGNDGQVVIWDVHSYQPVRLLKGTGDWAWCAEFSPDSKTVVSGSDDALVLCQT